RDSISGIKEEHPDAVVVAHPECTYSVRMLADEVCSTEKMVTFCKNSKAKNIIVVTESGMIHRLRKEAPDKNLIAGPTDKCNCSDCRYMKMNTMEKLHDCLLNLSPQVTMDEEVRKRAEEPILRMLEMSK
ncbi:MAG: quinolinate synthase NadA, partial [Verrucomicrobiales bacterium]|nr:quinolinate synthase NadA [Verrucomicrobiales bacterium]